MRHEGDGVVQNEFRFDTGLTAQDAGERLLALERSNLWPPVRDVRNVAEGTGNTVTAHLGLGFRAEWRIAKQAGGSTVYYRIRTPGGFGIFSMLVLLAAVWGLRHFGRLAAWYLVWLAFLGILGVYAVVYVLIFRATTRLGRAARDLVQPSGVGAHTGGDDGA